ncbi:ROK family transcriptional regulator [Clostridia bacterium]|nr:ROK family transcriptional regulator [Clostridia bacterium]
MSKRLGVRDIGEYNRKRILRILREIPDISRAELVKETSLAAPSISRIVAELIDAGLIQEVGIGTSKGGRKPICLRINPNARYVIGVDIKPDKVMFVRSNLYSIILDRIEIPLKIKSNQSDAVKYIIDELGNFIESTGIDMSNLVGIGIAVPGLIDSLNGVVRYSSHLDWKNVQLRKLINEKIDVSVYLENTTTAAMIAERWEGHGKNLKNFIYLYIGEGIGAAYILNDQIYRGSYYSSIELGHTIICPKGDLCSCGKYGCWEAMASSRALRKSYLRYKKQQNQEIRDFSADFDEQDQMVQAILLDEKDGVKAIRECMDYLVIGLVNVVNTFIPERIVINGWPRYLRANQKLEILNEVKEKAMNGLEDIIDIEYSEQAKDGPIKGATMTALNDFFSV